MSSLHIYVVGRWNSPIKIVNEVKIRKKNVVEEVEEEKKIVNKTLDPQAIRRGRLE